jgi:hypothetical protein
MKKFLCFGASIWIGQITLFIKAVASGVREALSHSLLSFRVSSLRQ